MACEVCEHCQERLTSGCVIRDGCSYHDKCHKCYVCSETNLIDAEVFKGVIFCSSCSKRIFQGCSSARRSKDSNRSKARQTRPRRHSRPGARRDSYRGADTRVLELAELYQSVESNFVPNKRNRISKISTGSAVSHVGTEIDGSKFKQMKKDSLEMGMTTDVTQELLKEIHCPVVEKTKRAENYQITKSKDHRRRRNARSRRHKHRSVDLRIAELGASTEIATMTLRKQSDLPVRISRKSPIPLEPRLDSWNITSSSIATTKSTKDLLVDSDETLKTCEECEDEETNITIRSLIKLPFQFFKRNILDRSSVISIIMSSKKSDKPFFSRFKTLFYDEVNVHRNDGIRKLYSTINHRKTPYKLGWLHISKMEMRKNYHTGCRHQMGRCKHYRNSHSYRCLRAHVMKRAGPTKSELAMFRSKIAKAIAPAFLKKLLNTQQPAITASAACGVTPVFERKSVIIELSNDSKED